MGCRVLSVVVGLATWVSCGMAAWAMTPDILWMIESAQYAGTLQEQVARFEVRYTIQVVQPGGMQIPIELPGTTVTSVTLEGSSRNAHVAPQGHGYVLITSTPGAYRVRVRCALRLMNEGPYERLQFGIPQAVGSTLTMTIPRTDVELRPEDRLIAEVRPRAGGSLLSVQLGSLSQVDLGWRVKPVEPQVVEPLLQATVQTLVTVEEQRVRLASVIAYRLAQGTVKALRLQLPSRLSVTNVRGASISDWRVSQADGVSLLTVTLADPLKDAGSYQLVLEAEEPLASTQASYAVAELVLLDVKQEQGDVAIARQGSLELSPSQVEGIRRVDVRELPEALSASSPSAIVLGFTYHQHPYRMALGLTRHDDHPVLSAIAEEAELVSIVSRGGDLITRGVYLIKANRQQFLTVTLPEGATLWSCLVAGAAIKPVEGEHGRLLIPLDQGDPSTRGISVELVYVARHPQMRGLGHLRLQGPTLDVPTTLANWSVYTPQDVRWLRVRGNVERGMIPVTFVDDPEETLRLGSTASPQIPIYSLFEKGRMKQDEKGSERDVLARGASLSESSTFQDANGSGSGKAGLVRSAETRLDGFSDAVAALQQRGILPLTIRLPKAGRVQRFNRVLTTDGPLTLDADVMVIGLPWLAVAGLILCGSVAAALATLKVTRR